MTTAMRYPIPAGEYRQVAEITRSRFITTVAHTPTVSEAEAFIARIRAEFPDATHNCWAYVVGPPGSTARIGKIGRASCRERVEITTIARRLQRNDIHDY